MEDRERKCDDHYKDNVLWWMAISDMCEMILGRAIVGE